MIGEAIIIVILIVGIIVMKHWLEKIFIQLTVISQLVTTHDVNESTKVIGILMNKFLESEKELLKSKPKRGRPGKK